MTEDLREKVERFRENTERFANGEISVKDYKGLSGGCGSYAQRGAKASMLRLRMTGGRITKEGLKSIIDICAGYGIDKLHCTTCSTIQLHDIPFDKVADVMTDAIESGFYTPGGGGDYPRNVMVSPLSGVEKGENFDVAPYAEKTAEYLISMIDRVKMPRKLKVGFSNSPKNEVHATFRDLGFVSRSDGLFDVYIAGGLGSNPRMGVKIDEAVPGEKVLYYVKAMIAFFCEFGNYENRAKARTRYMQETLGADFEKEYRKKLSAALAEGGLDIAVKPREITKSGSAAEISSRRLIEQKQPGLYAVKFHPIGGMLDMGTIERIYEAVRGIPEAELRVSPDETIYIVNCDGMEAKTVLKATEGGAESDIEESVSCIGASVCQQGLRDSRELLAAVLAAVKPCGFLEDALPKLHISGCRSSCGTHMIGKIGFHGKGKMVDKKLAPAFSIHLNGCDEQGHERFGEELGVVLSEDIPKLMVEIGNAVASERMSYDEFAEKHGDRLREIIGKYI